MELNGLKIGITLALLFATCVGYAFALQTERGRLLARRRTWLTVVIGDALILAALGALLPWQYALLAIAAFVLAGAPMVARSIYNELCDEGKAVERMRK